MKPKYTLFFLLIFIFFGNVFGKSNSPKTEITKDKIFYDKFSNLPVRTKITNEINTPKKVDGIIYFSSENKYYKRVYKYLTPEMFGAKGDGKTDDYYAIQEMLDKGEVGCTFYFNGKKTYYNAFANKGLWIEPMKRNIWQRNKAATFLFNGAKLRRRMPEWNDKNRKTDYNDGAFYTDDHTALLYLTGSNFVIDRADFHSNVPLGILLDEDENPTHIKDYAVGTCMEMGLWLENCKNVKVKNSTFSNSVFPVYVNRCENLNFENINLKYAAQANRRINNKDPALGGGIKLIQSKNVNITNVTGYRNLNDTVEIETLNSNVNVSGRSEYDYANSLVIMSSQYVKLNWTAKNVQHGTGLIIIGSEPNDLATKNISGKISVDTTSWCGVLIWLYNNTTNNLSDINLDITTTKTGYAGLFVNNESDNYVITGLNLKHKSTNDGTGSGVARMFNNAVEGVCSGSTSGANTGVKVTGKSSQNPISAKLDFQDNVKVKYDIAETATLKIL